MADSKDVKTPKAKRAAGNKISNNLVALSSAAVFSVYMAGYLKTSAAADRLEAASTPRRSNAPVQVEGAQRPGRSEAAPSVDSRMPETGRGAALEAPQAPAVALESKPVAAQTAEESRQAPAHAVVEKPASNRDASPAPAEAAAAPVAPAPAEPAPAPAAVVAAVDHPAPEPPAASPAPAAAKYKDGTFTGWGTSRHGDIEAQVVIEGGRIVSATISQCWTRYPCSYIAPLPPQVVQRQSPEIDFVSRATDSTNAFYYGLVQALAKAKPQNER
jgi:uncharacterized protein with FMN-binding domain